MAQLVRLPTSCSYFPTHCSFAGHAELSSNSSFITLILDTVGRKKPLMFGAGSFVVTYSVLTAIVAYFPPGVSENHPAQRAGIAMIFITSIFFSLSFGPVSWVLASEVLYAQICRLQSLLTRMATSEGIPNQNAIHRHKCCNLCKLGFQRSILPSALSLISER